MARETVLFRSEERKSRDEVAQFLRQIADRLQSGSVTLIQGEERLQLDIPTGLTLEIKVEEEQKRDGPRRSLEIEVEWREGDSGDTGGVVLG